MSGRARGRHMPRPPAVDPDSREGHGIGASDRMQGGPSPIPGGRVHITNAQSVEQQTPVPDSPPEVKDLNAHGVEPGTHTARERAEAMRGPNTFKPLVPKYAKPEKRPEPVPVYLVQNDVARVLRTAAPRHITLQASTGEPVRLCGKDFGRSRILLLNESTASNIRFAQTYNDCTNGGGALLPWPANTYLTLGTQDELWGISADSGTPVISVIQEFEQTW